MALSVPMTAGLPGESTTLMVRDVDRIESSDLRVAFERGEVDHQVGCQSFQFVL